MALRDELELLWGEVEQLGRPIVGNRNPGLDPTEIRDRLGTDTPDEVVAWFEFGNGVAYIDGQTQNDAALIPGYEPVSLDEAIVLREGNFDSDGILEGWWLPLLASGGGDFYAAVSNTATSSFWVVSVMVGGDSRRAFRSIEEMAASFVRMYRDGTFFVQSDGVLWADYDRWIALEAG